MTTFRRLLTALLASVLVLAAACGGDDGGRAAATRRRAATAGTGRPVPRCGCPTTTTPSRPRSTPPSRATWSSSLPAPTRRPSPSRPTS